MPMRGLGLLAVLFATCAAPIAAQAQAQAPRVSFALNAAYQPTITRFDDRFTFMRYQETGTTRVEYPVQATFLADAGADVRLWHGLGAGFAVSRFGRKGSASTFSSVPHPLYLERHRRVEGRAESVGRQETGIHVQVRYQLPLAGRLRVGVSGGPSLLRVRQTLVTEARFREEYPYDTAEPAGVNTREVEGTATGFNVGAELGWMFTRHVGFGGALRFTRAEIDLDLDGARTIPVDAGGSHLGLGLRLAF